jgi:hypothetical protein
MELAVSVSLAKLAVDNKAGRARSFDRVGLGNYGAFSSL